MPDPTWKSYICCMMHLIKILKIKTSTDSLSFWKNRVHLFKGWGKICWHLFMLFVFFCLWIHVTVFYCLLYPIAVSRHHVPKPVIWTWKKKRLSQSLWITTIAFFSYHAIPITPIQYQVIWCITITRFMQCVGVYPRLKSPLKMIQNCLLPILFVDSVRSAIISTSLHCS